VIQNKPPATGDVVAITRLKISLSYLPGFLECPSQKQGCLPRRVCSTVGRHYGTTNLALQISVAAVAFAGDGVDACNSIINLIKEAMLVTPLG
jgi:hypothetical protein